MTQCGPVSGDDPSGRLARTPSWPNFFLSGLLGNAAGPSEPDPRAQPGLRPPLEYSALLIGERVAIEMSSGFLDELAKFQAEIKDLTAGTAGSDAGATSAGPAPSSETTNVQTQARGVEAAPKAVAPELKEAVAAQPRAITSAAPQVTNSGASASRTAAVRSAPPRPRVAYSSAPKLLSQADIQNAAATAAAAAAAADRVASTLAAAGSLPRAAAQVQVGPRPIVPGQGLPAPAAGVPPAKRENRKRRFLRTAAGKVWEDKTLGEWPEGDFRLFCGDLGNEVTDAVLANAFQKYGSFAKAKVIRDKRTQKSRGYGFASFLDPFECAAALREVNGNYVGNRPIKLRRHKGGQRDFNRSTRKQRKILKKGIPTRIRGAHTRF